MTRRREDLVRRFGRARRVSNFVMAVGLALSGAGSPRAAEPPYWLQFGKPAQTCDGAGEMPFKVEGASWGVLASGVVLCRETGDAFTYDLRFLNVRVDVFDKDMITRPSLDFDWFGLAMFRPKGQNDDIDWLFDRSLPVKGSLRRDGTGKIVFGNLSFVVPKSQAAAATNMIFYLTFSGPLVVITAV